MKKKLLLPVRVQLTLAAIVTTVLVVVLVWGVSTHGFKDMRSYNLGYNAGLQDKTSVYPAGCLSLLLLALESSDAPGLKDLDFTAGYRASGDRSGIPEHTDR